jgi:hypothetical protein
LHVSGSNDQISYTYILYCKVRKEGIYQHRYLRQGSPEGLLRSHQNIPQIVISSTSRPPDVSSSHGSAQACASFFMLCVVHYFLFLICQYFLRTETYTSLSLGHAVAQLVDVLRYKPEVRGFDSRWCYWNFLLT